MGGSAKFSGKNRAKIHFDVFLCVNFPTFHKIQAIGCCKRKKEKNDTAYGAIYGHQATTSRCDIVI